MAPFPVQAATLPDAIAGRDVLGRGRTGSGKTLAFVLPVLIRLAQQPQRVTSGRPRALILAPTRELARQILQVIEPLAWPLGLRSVAVFGGVAVGPQARHLRRGVDVVVACPGRLEDLIRSGATSLAGVEISVLDEADHMADLGFLPAVRRLLDQTPPDGQRLLFSATLDDAVDVLVRRYLTDPVVHDVDDDRSTIPAVDHHVLHIAPDDRLAVLVDLTSAPGRAIVFTRTKHRARQLTRQLVANGVPAVELHGNLTQGARTRNLEAFSSGRALTLVATDIAARGLHIDDVELVIHADPPVEHKAYLHRSGRTARAGAGGTVVTLATKEQHAEVARLGRRAGIEPQVTRHQPGHPILRQVAPGTRTRVEVAPVAMSPDRPPRKARKPVTTPGFESRRRRRPPTTAGSQRGARTARRGR
ncbi:MAG TPA: DEAD/DEAH box helicase [Acidimicrobiales bacterium]|nr:DEAD/DEAH box helicase [Acidimicrobiales bacterium]